MRYLITILLCTAIAHAQEITRTIDKDGRYVEHIDKETDIEMILVQGGSFDMGSNNNPDEQPIHRVTLDGYYIGKYEVTQQQWESVVHYNLSDHTNCPTCPVDGRSWGDIQEFLYNLNKMTGKHYRLPTEAEWEYAARGGSRSKHYAYSGSNNYNSVAWCGDHYITDADKTHPVGLKEPNELGLYDMSGNTLEWCSDWYDADYYKLRASNNPTGPATGKYKIARGGSYLTKPEYLSATYRSQGGSAKVDTGARWKTLGFRIVRER
ncbi:MAG: Sulphatase-modifying factor protein [Flavipsychrobacter sp.]|nr:Sulphatase-modifying factor protein [Flavipsychrobacter sp.]